MADWGLPLTTSNYADVLSELKARDDSAAKMFDGTTETSLPTGAVRWNSSTHKLQKWNGSTWDNESGRLDLTDGLASLTSAEVAQLQNIGSTTLSAAQWGYLGSLNQELATSSTPTFGGLTLSGVLDASGSSMQCAKVLFDNLSTASLSADGEMIYDLSEGIYYQRGGQTLKLWDSGNDGAGSDLDADLLDGLHASAFAQSGGGDFPNVTNNVAASSSDFNSIYNVAVNSTNSRGTYQNFFNGTIVQWGTYVTGSDVGDATGEANITFPIAFSGKPHTFIFSTEYLGKSNITANAESVSNSSAEVVVLDLDDSSGEDGVTVNWWAIGDTPFIV